MMSPPGFEVGLIGLLLTCALVWYAIGTVLDDEPHEARFLRLVFLGALLLRVGLAVGTYALLPYGFAAPDEAGYVSSAQKLMISGHLDLGQIENGSGWQYFNFLLFYLLGVNPLLPRLWNCAVGSITPILAYSLARTMGARSGARWTAVLVAFFPSLVLWSSLNLKDADVWLLVLGGLLLATRMQQSFRYLYLPALAIIIAALEPLRRYADQALAVAVGVGIAVSALPIRLLGLRLGAWRGFGLIAAIVAVLLVLIAYVFPATGESLYRSAGLVQLATLRHDFAIGATSAINPDPGLGTLQGTLAFLPEGMRDFFLRPYPWESGSGLLESTRIEVVAYYVTLPVAALGILYSLRAGAVRALPSLTFLIIAAVGYALVIANLGTIYREREQLVVVVFAFVGVGAEAIRSAVSPGQVEDRKAEDPAPIRRGSASTADSGRQ